MLDFTRSDDASSPLPARPTGGDMMPFVAANAWIKAAMHCRFNIEPLFMAAGVHFDTGSVATVRKNALIRLMQQCVDQAAPQHHFPLVLGELFAFDHLPALETFLATSPTLRHALPALQWASISMPDLSLQVQDQGLQSVLLLDVDIPKSEQLVRGYFVEAVFAAICKIVRLALGSTRLVQHIDVQHAPHPLFVSLAASLPTEIRPSQSRDAAVFATRLLDMPLPGASPGLHQRAQELVRQQMPVGSGQLVALIERTFKQTPALLGQGLDRMAQRLELHPRTLQRHLHKQGQQFTEIQSRCRLDIARAALSARPCDIESLSAQLGFADRHSFTRAFKRWTGLSPSAFARRPPSGQSGDKP